MLMGLRKEHCIVDGAQEGTLMLVGLREERLMLLGGYFVAVGGGTMFLTNACASE